jgi:Flp pilus assembly protein TadG
MKTLAKQTRGQSLVEFALVIPMLLILMVGIMEFSRAWMTKNILTGAAREAARMYAVQNNTLAADVRADNVLRSASLDPLRWTITPIPLNPLDNSVGYTVAYNFPVSVAGFVPGLSNPSFLLSSTTTMRKEWP